MSAASCLARSNSTLTASRLPPAARAIARSSGGRFGTAEGGVETVEGVGEDVDGFRVGEASERVAAPADEVNCAQGDVRAFGIGWLGWK